METWLSPVPFPGWDPDRRRSGLLLMRLFRAFEHPARATFPWGYEACCFALSLLRPDERRLRTTPAWPDRRAAPGWQNRCCPAAARRLVLRTASAVRP